MIKILKYFEIIPSVAHVRQPPILHYNPIRGLSRTFADIRGHTQNYIFVFCLLRKNVRKSPRMSTKIHNNTSPRMSANIRESPRHNFIQADIRGLSRTFADTQNYIFVFCLLRKSAKVRESPADTF